MGEVDKPVVVFCLGGPGSGKGTQCIKIEEEFGYRHISAGDCLREERNDPNSELKPLIDDYIKNGQIVPVKITCELLKKKMRKYGWDGGKYIIDGFPRNFDNYTGWNESCGETVDTRLCLQFVVDRNEMVDRILSRAAADAEKTGQSRIDDTRETISKRLEVYEQDTLKIIQIFAENNKCVRLDAMGTIDEVWNRVKSVFEKLESSVKENCSDNRS